jgi:chromate transporter
MSIALSATDWLSLLLHFMLLSLLSVGGAITTAPDMHRWLVQEQGWLADPQFSASIAIAQAAPGPNVLFVALLCWNVGVNAGGHALGMLGVVLGIAGILVPSCTLTYAAASWGHRNRELRAVRAFKQGMGPVVVALLVATGWVLATGARPRLQDWPVWLLAVAATIIVWKTRLHLLWLLAAGGVLGWFGLV